MQKKSAIKKNMVRKGLGHSSGIKAFWISSPTRLEYRMRLRLKIVRYYLSLVSPNSRSSWWYN